MYYSSHIFKSFFSTFYGNNNFISVFPKDRSNHDLKLYLRNFSNNTFKSFIPLHFYFNNHDLKSCFLYFDSHNFKNFFPKYFNSNNFKRFFSRYHSKHKFKSLIPIHFRNYDFKTTIVSKV